MKTLIVVDMQNDFIDGSLGTREAQAIVPKVKEKIKEASGGTLHRRHKGLGDCRRFRGAGMQLY